MPKVHKSGRAKHICDGVPRGGERFLNTSCSLFVLLAAFAAWAYIGETAAEYHLRVTLEAGMTATTRLTRASVPAAKVADTTGASSTQWCRHFQQA
jgi:hypothetical protein